MPGSTIDDQQPAIIITNEIRPDRIIPVSIRLPLLTTYLNPGITASQTMPSDSENAPSPASKAFADRLAKYAYAAASSPPSPRMSPLRRSTRSQTSNSAAPRSPLPSTPQERIYDRGSPLKKVASSSSSSVSLSATKKRSAKSISKEDEEFQDIDTEEETDDESYRREKPNSGGLKGGRTSTMKKVVKKPRGYAAPEMYEHLRPLNDLLAKGQDCELCLLKPLKRLLYLVCSKRDNGNLQS